jgi:hypothetical protein
MKEKPPKKRPVRQKKVIPKKPPFEYRMLITPRIDERTKSTHTYMAIRTMQEFTSFRYDLVVVHKVKQHVLRFDIRGLRAPRLTMPGFGPAIFETKGDHLKGKFDVVVHKLDKETNVFGVRITDREVVVEQRPEKPFIEIVTRMEDW